MSSGRQEVEGIDFLQKRVVYRRNKIGTLTREHDRVALVYPAASITLRLRLPCGFDYPTASFTLRLRLPYGFVCPAASITLRLRLPYGFVCPEASISLGFSTPFSLFALQLLLPRTSISWGILKNKRSYLAQLGPRLHRLHPATPRKGCGIKDGGLVFLFEKKVLCQKFKTLRTIEILIASREDQDMPAWI